jgi:hypothetical protein
MDDITYSSAASSLRGLSRFLPIRIRPLQERNPMSLVARSTRAAVRTISRTRPYSVVVDAPASEWVAKREAIKHHAEGTFPLPQWPISPSPN